MAKGSRKQIPAGRIHTGPPRKAIPAQAARLAGFDPQAPELFRVRWTRFDYRGRWCIGVSASVDIVDLMTRLRDMEQLTPVQVFSGELGKDYGDPARLPCKPARQRLSELGLADETCISRLRIGSMSRLYGFRRDPEFYAVFWDPKHEIWPSKR